MDIQNQYLLEMIDIDKTFPGVHALDRAQLRLRPGTIHSLMGENGAGKSTLMKCLFGIYKKDSGIVRIEGKEVNFTSPKHALDSGVAMVHQELNQVLHRNVMENVWLGRLPLKKYGLVDSKLMYKETQKVFNELEIHISPTAIIGTLSVSQRQMVEIAKAVSYGAKIMVLDEPTSSLTEKEVEHLFRIIRKLTMQGVGIIYISHRIDEILRISDDITVMRDGQWITTKPATELDNNELIRLMVNRDLTHRFPEKTNKPSGVMMSVSNLSGKYEPTFHDVSFTLRKGEVLGIAGLVGSRRTELLNTIFGVFTKESGEIKVNGEEINNSSPVVAIRNGFALITEERRATGLFPLMNIYFNTIIANIDRYGKLLLSKKKISNDTRKSIDNLKVKTPTAKTAIRSLSGGNQQKVIIGRWLLTSPEILLLDEPTRGIDVGAKFEIYQLIINLANDGKGIIMVSSEMPELLGICDRILVMSNGRLAGIVERGKDFGGIQGEQEHILKLAGTYI
ncbi:MAG: ATP-binding cassette domain-containing protein [Sphaerochaetaceae bacterium]|jgi:methyl-galactoside transport system ATP-binding protein|nr:ATP-binding cassette domain-containing protein [Sphaerochaetaceae bacterium]NLO61434.1 ATP-binding cassette domain-containing protein [Spirochaetales bacterium]MDD2406291.1 ATP-binding cassette domain-containing protein [Sphaerochaetaceae bacterium]MDD3669917.1 ATP-binding cassette domain-containing protein [Sphaerochaetaceae bacterium]MDD4258564.1 ATP-binding cassette domain-containing protein [Sphaerochaetaceae bacterium]